MNINDTNDLDAISRWVSSRLEKTTTASRDIPYLNLLRVLLNDTTPYLGAHGRVENALRLFRRELKVK